MVKFCFLFINKVTNKIIFSICEVFNTVFYTCRNQHTLYTKCIIYSVLSARHNKSYHIIPTFVKFYFVN